MHDGIICKLNQRATEYQQWIFDEQKKAEEILRESDYVVPRIRTRINPWPNDFRILLKMANENEKNDKNERCDTINKLTELEYKFIMLIHFPSNLLSKYLRMNSLLSKINHTNNASHLSAAIAIGVRDFCAKRTANAVCRKRQILEAVAEKTRKLREDSHRRVKQRKIQLEKEGEEKRKESSIKIKQQAIKTISNRGRKVHDLPGTPVAKRTRNALGLMPIDKRFCCRGTEAFHDDNSNHLSTTLHKDNEDYLSATFHEKHLSTTSANQTVCIKSSPEIAILSELETAISKKSNTEGIFPSKFNCNTPRMNNSSDTLTAISSPDKHTKQRHTGISRIDASKSHDTLRVHTSKNSTSQKDVVDTDANNSLSKRSTSLNTASVLERTRPDDKSVDITQRSTNAIHRDKIDSDDNTVHNDTTKRSTYFIHDLKCEQNIISSDDNNDSNSRNNDDLRVMSMDLKSSSCQSKSTTMHADDDDNDDDNDDDDKVKRIEEKRGKVTSTRFPGRKTESILTANESSNGITKKSKTAICHSAQIKRKNDLENVEIYNLSSGDPTDYTEKPSRKIPFWAKKQNLQQILIKQQKWSIHDIDALFGKIHPPDMQKMFGDKMLSATRSSSAIWESPIWNPRVGYSAYHMTFQQIENDNNIRRSQRAKKLVSYVTYF
ncbi:unnamed protein product [Brugia pahangi]|uniref:INCENP_ARK-bind domain-containing protein n=1 Tax=Brugia pahangi TaxID=6280 RepID=A0A0N4TVV5_BRUPA|nr:unnamed protein product [Brugia pahangi]